MRRVCRDQAGRARGASGGARLSEDLDWLRDLLDPLGPIQIRKMFGGAGVYRDGRMFGLVSDGELFLKADELTLSRFREAGCRPFTYEKNGRPVEMSYFSVPEEALEVRDLLAGWVSVACEAAARTKRPARKRA